MEFDPNSNVIVNILNNVLKNINEDIAFLRSDFKKLNDLVIVLSVKVNETKEIRKELSQIASKVETISKRLYELEKAKEKLELLITQVDKNHASQDALSDLTIDKKIEEISAKIKSYDEKLPWLWTILIAIFVLIGITLYVTNTHVAAFSLFAKFFALF